MKKKVRKERNCAFSLSLVHRRLEVQLGNEVFANELFNYECSIDFLHIRDRDGLIGLCIYNALMSRASGLVVLYLYC